MAHHTGDGPARPSVQDVASYQTNPGAHIDFPGFAYTSYVEADGKLYLTNDLHAVSWANGDGSPTAIQGVGIYNWWTFSCCFSGENPTQAQLDSMAKAHSALEHVLGRTIEARGHRQVSGASDTECPGPQMYLWLPKI